MMDSTHAGRATLALGTALAFGLAFAPFAAHAQTARPAPQPSPSTVAPGQTETPLVPAGVDTGIPGTGNRPASTGNVMGDNTPRKVLQRRGQSTAASAPAVDDRAASKAAARPLAKPAASAPR